VRGAANDGRRVPYKPALPKKNPEAGALGAPVLRLVLAGRPGVGGTREKPFRSVPNHHTLGSLRLKEVDARHKMTL
jgi:hypothetical protein